MAIVPVTAMPYAAPRAPDERKPRTSRRQPTISAVLTSGMKDAGSEQVEGMLDGAGHAEEDGALPEVVEQERGQHEAEPGQTDGPAPEVSHVRVEGLGAGDGQDHG